MRCLRTVLALTCLALLSGASYPQEKLVTLTNDEKAAAIETVCVRLKRFYVLPDVAARMETHIRMKLAEGAFDKTADAKEFADSLTRELRSISHDKHLGLFFGPDPDLRPKQDAGLERLLARSARQEQNYGLDGVEILEGNVGYMRIRSVMFYEEVKAILDASMAFLANADALIFDLRGNRGGDPQFMAYLFGYFFEKPTPTTRIYWRDRDRTDEFWTREAVPGEKRPDLPLFVLIFGQTFSGAEEFAYDLQALKRATIVGEASAGGANPASSWVVYRDLRISIPIGRAINPVTGTNWEGVGVKPDVEVAADSALSAALELAAKAGKQRREDRRGRLLAKYQLCRAGIEEARKLIGAERTQAAETLVTSTLNEAVENKLHTESSINSLGYEFLRQDELSMAIAVFKANVSRFPDSANAYDSLGEAYGAAGRKELAIESYERSLKLDPGNANAAERLKTLKRKAASRCS